MTHCFRDAQQRSEACRALLATGELGHFWNEQGPTEEAWPLPETRASSPRGTAPFCSRRWPSGPASLSPSASMSSSGSRSRSRFASSAQRRFYGPNAVDVWLDAIR